MRRRITVAIVGVTALVLIALSIPLAIVANRSLVNEDLLKLQTTATQTLGEIGVPLGVGELAALEDEPDAPDPFSVYLLDGSRLFGSGPPTADEPVRGALGGSTASSTGGGEAVVATPILAPQTERILGVLRVSRSLRDAERKTLLSQAVIVAGGAMAVGVAWFVARRGARLLSDPIERLADLAAGIGDGETLLRHDPSGVAEIDQLGEALAQTSRRLNETLVRERQFSADVSHQLRTPLTGLRLKFEARTPNSNGWPTSAAEALADLDRIDATVEHLLAYARDGMPMAGKTALGEAIDRARRRWSEPVARASRRLEILPGPDIDVRASAASIDQILDVLIDNALRHGAGDITLGARSLPGGGAIDVGDQGAGAEMSEAELFARGHGAGHGAGHGIGLALARALAEANAGRLLWTQRRPTTFSLILLVAEAT